MLDFCTGNDPGIHIRKIRHRNFAVGIADIVSFANCAPEKCLEKAGDGVGDVAERPRLAASAVNGEGPAVQGLIGKHRDYSPVVVPHSGSENIEGPYDPYRHIDRKS